jgi:hypothetical protein
MTATRALEIWTRLSALRAELRPMVEELRQEEVITPDEATFLMGDLAAVGVATAALFAESPFPRKDEVAA